ncbi:GAF domain-containing protein [Halorhodospira halochloris]|uniref:GAF domain-containing sensor histidine kinase n=1 Tax=Halorhodospira halochloris TaxID=1052 RepID=UPI001EE8DEC1|nr:ATP-binding protein [Halorhodospira halochloris]MCG5531240.1 GAF domain-containing protein [Halorhodospira halochloris]
MSAAPEILSPCAVFDDPSKAAIEGNQLDKICALGVQISSANTLDQLLNGYLYELVQSTGAYGGAIRLYDQQTNLRLVEAYGLDSGFVDLERRRPAEKCFCNAAAHQQQVRCNNDLQFCTRKVGRSPVTTHPGLAMLAVPITEGPATLGIFNLYFERGQLDNWAAIPQVMLRLGQQLGGAISRIRQQQQNQQSSIQQERMLLAHELHDTIVQEIAVLRLHIRRLEANATSKQATIKQLRERIEQLSGRIDSANNQVREVMQQFHSQALGAELDTALKRLVNRFRRDSQINIRLLNNWPTQALEERQELHIHRIVEEALTNAWHHGNAKNVLIVLATEDTELHLLIEDDGRGFHSTTASADNNTKATALDKGGRGFGLPGMRERARQLGALLQIDSEPEQGTQIHLQLPAAQIRDWLSKGPARTEEDHNARAPC